MHTQAQPGLPAGSGPRGWRLREAAAVGALAGGLHALATVVFLSWCFRAHILAPPLAGRLQLFDPASKLLGFIHHTPADFLQHFYGPGLIAKAPLVIEILTPNLFLGALLGFVVALGLRWWPRPRSAWASGALFALGFLSVITLLHLAALVPAVVDPFRTRPIPFILRKLASRLWTDGPLVDLALTAGAVALALWVAPRLQPARKLGAILGAGAFAVVALAALGSTLAPNRAVGARPETLRAVPAARPRNVVLISIDSLRADHLGCYGYNRPTSPLLDRLAAQGVRFNTAYAGSSWTLPSHATMLTGRYPLSHGAVLRERRLTAATPTIATVLQHVGYKTGGFVSYEFLRRRYYFHVGFDYYDDFTTDLDTDQEEHSRMTGPLLNTQIIPWIEGNADRPFFLFVHYFDVHFNYDPPPPYDTMFDPDYVGPDLRRFSRNPAIHRGMPKRHLEHLIALYDGEIRFTDGVVGEVVDAINRAGIGAETLLIVTADHGDEFFEHGNKGHGTTLYDEVLRVPLLVHWPEGVVAGRVVEDPVSLADLAPTIYELLGVAAPPGLEGQSLVPLLLGERDQSRLVYAHLHTPKRPLIWAMARQGKQKYLQDLNAPRAALYELDVDPGEQRNRVHEATSQALATPLLVWLGQQWGAYRVLPSDERHIVIDSQSIEKLRALGYVD